MPTPHPVRGILAGVAGGLVASWLMNEFIAKANRPLTEAAETAVAVYEEHVDPEAAQKKKSKKRKAQQEDTSGGQPQPDATMKAADAIAAKVTGGRHLTWQQEEIGGPIVHYAFGALAGGLYGALAEYSPLVRSGFGLGFGAVLFAAADLLAVPAVGLSKPLSDYPASSYASPFAAHLVYGLSTELTRRLARTVL